MIAKNKQLQLVDDDIEHTHTRCQIISKAAIHALIHDYQSLILKDKQTRHSKIKTTILILCKMSITLASLNTVMLTNLNSQVHILANYNKAFLYFNFRFKYYQYN